METSIRLPTERDTFHLGRLLGRRAVPGCLVALVGELGAGKTRLTQGLAAGLDVPEDEAVVSPTYALVHEYAGRHFLFHLDVYRLDEEEFLAAGLDEYFDGRGVCAVEWADRVWDLLPDDRLEIELVPAGAGGRRAVLKARGRACADLLAAVAMVFKEDQKNPLRW